jgi:putative membrane protein
MLLHLLLSWLISALSIWIVAQVVPGFQVSGFATALWAAVVIALVNGTIGFVLKILTFPLTLLTLGLFLLILNALLLKLAAAFVPGFSIRGFLPALIGSILITVLNWILRSALM